MKSYIEIPQGYKQVFSGNIKTGDLVYNTETMDFDIPHTGKVSHVGFVVRPCWYWAFTKRVLITVYEQKGNVKWKSLL